MLEQEDKRNSGVFNDMDTTKTITHISLCAGYGGIDLGLKRVISNLRTICYSEIEAYAAANLVAKMEQGLLDVAPIWTNLKTFPWSEFYGKVDIISGGFPCQPFSTSGHRKADQDPRHLFPYIKRGIELVRPAIVFFENVEGIISTKLGSDGDDVAGTSVLLHVLRQLERLDYKTTAGIFSASECGAPHQRRRVFILGVSNDSRNAFRKLSIRPDPNVSNGWPSFKGQQQKSWEPKRVLLDHSNVMALQDIHVDQRCNLEKIKRQKTIMSSDARLYRTTKAMDTQGNSESKMVGVFNGHSNWMDYGELSESVCNRTDEIRMLGNGVVPATAAKAFRTLWSKLVNSNCT
jgi:DNA (cytosine-5)-methyltransferase 1